MNNGDPTWVQQTLTHIRWMVRLRWLAMLGAMAALAAATVLQAQLPIVPLTAVTVLIGLYNLLFYLFTEIPRPESPDSRLGDQARRLVHLQIILDLTALTLLLHYAGGAENPFFPYYVFHVTLAAVVLSARASFVYAAVATGLYSGMIWLEYFGTISHVHLVGLVDPDLYRREIYLLAISFALATTVFFAALVVGGLARRLRARERELMESQTALEARASELAAANDKLEKLDRAKTQFMMMVTHELRAPVAAIQSFLQLILQGYVPIEKQTSILERSSERATGLLNLIGDLLLLSQVRESPAEAKLQLVDPRGIFQRVADLMQAQAREKGLTFKLEIAEDLPQMFINPRDMEVVWTNLLSNAVKYTGAGGTVVASLQNGPEGLVGRVQDTGIGIPPDALGHVFEEFFRTENAKAMETRGTGLGLSIVKRIMDNYGGQLTVQSTLGEGSTFTFVWAAEDGVPRQESATP